MLLFISATSKLPTTFMIHDMQEENVEGNERSRTSTWRNKFLLLAAVCTTTVGMRAV